MTETSETFDTVLLKFHDEILAPVARAAGNYRRALRNAGFTAATAETMAAGFYATYLSQQLVALHLHNSRPPPEAPAVADYPEPGGYP